ncbi:MAG: M50 family metallopeptidase [Fibrella sp.]|nr:M50 family metallopeptidase [Armatimonadota bacterium]
MSYPKPSTFDKPDNLPGVRSLQHLIIAALITAGLYFVPYLGWVTYPIRLFVTFIHEGAHALAAVITGGHVQSLVIRPDGSGVTWSAGGFGILVSSAGYLGATLFGALLVAALRRGIAAKSLLLATGVLIGLMTIGWVRPPDVTELGNFGLSVFAGIALSVALVFGGLRLPERSAAFAVSFLGVQCILNALFDLNTLLSISVAGGTQSDAGNMARMTLIPAPVWAVLWIAVAAFMLWRVVLVPAFRDARRSATV